jgi:hypothetical protein
MTAKQLLKKALATYMSRKVKFAQANLDNGTILEAEAFEAGNEVFIVTDEERIPLPVGEYTMEDGSILVVSEEGLIAEVKTATAIEAEDETVEVEVPEEVAAQVEQVVNAVVEVIAPMIEEVKEEMQKLKEQMGKKEEMSNKKPATKPVRHNPAKNEPVAMNLAAARQKTAIDRVFDRLSGK